MKAFKKIYFNMVELALAIAIVAIGLTAVISVLPLALKTESQSKVKYYTSDIADLANSFAEMTLAGNWLSTVNDIPVIKPGMLEDDGKSWDITQYEGAPTDLPNLFHYKNLDEPKKGVYKVVLSSGTGSSKVNDLTGELRLWRTRKEDDLNPSFGENKFSQGGEKITGAQLVGINMEISCPVEKPYEQREKFKYYFEIFNYNRNVTVDDIIDDDEIQQAPGATPIIVKEDNEIIVNETSTLKITVIASELCSTVNNYHAPVYVRVCVKNPDDEGDGTVYNCFQGYKYLYSMTPDLSSDYAKRTGGSLKEIVAVPGESWEMEIPSGSSYKISASYYYNYSAGTYVRYDYYGHDNGFVITNYWSNNDYQVYTLLNGETPSRFSNIDSEDQLTPAECIQEYINDEGLVTLNNNQVLYLFELSHSTYPGYGFDMQDMIILAEITKN